MDINMEVTAKFSAEDVEAIVKAHLEKEGYDVSSVKSKVSKTLAGSQMHEYEVMSFDGIEAQIKVKKA